MKKVFCLFAAFGLFASLFSSGALAQFDSQRPVIPRGESAAESGRKEELKTIVTVEILTEGNSGILQLNQWRTVFRNLDVSVRIRSRVFDEKPETNETKRGTLRLVTVTGLMDRRGMLHFDGKSFNRNDSEKLREWLDELKTYGAEGSPEGKPAWGLSREAFDALQKSLSEPVREPTDNLPLATAIMKVDIPEEYPVRFSTATREWTGRRTREELIVHQNLEHFSRGTALATVLKELKLGFRPQRTPAGSVELVVEPLEKTTDVWPVGWDLPESLSRPQAFPRLFDIRVFQFRKKPLGEVLGEISTASETPILLDRGAFEKKGVDPQKILIDYEIRKTSPAVVLQRVTGVNRLKRQYRLDERGRPFIWVTTLELASSRQ